MLLITITLRLMFVPLAVGKANMVCLIVAFSIPCWLVALSLKIVWVGTPACWNNSSSSSISSKILLSSCSNWVRMRISGSVSPFPPMLDTFLSVSSILGLVVLFTPVTQSLLAIPKMAGLLEEMYSSWTHFSTKEIYQLLCCGPCIGCPGGAGPPEGMESVLRRVR